MVEVQYDYFRALDRRCVAESLDPDRCREVVRLKRQIIEAPINRSNPLVQDVLAGRTTFVQTYDEFSRAFRGLRRFAPKTHDPAWNERLDQLARIVPNVRHFRRRSCLALDNPVNTTLYGAVAGFALGVFWSMSGETDTEAGAAAVFLASRTQRAIVTALALVGFFIGTLAMLRYRTRDSAQIHAREAASYMDRNYALYRAGDDAAWARLLTDTNRETQAGVGR
jgi:hypothetical protein